MSNSLLWIYFSETKVSTLLNFFKTFPIFLDIFLFKNYINFFLQAFIWVLVKSYNSSWKQLFSSDWTEISHTLLVRMTIQSELGIVILSSIWCPENKTSNTQKLDGNAQVLWLDFPIASIFLKWNQLNLLSCILRLYFKKEYNQILSCD